MERLNDETGHYGIVIDELLFIPLYQRDKDTSGVGITFSTLPTEDESKELHGGGLAVYGYACRDRHTEKVMVQHQCRTAALGYDGARNTVENVVHLRDENARLLYQILPFTIKAVSEAECKAGITSSPLRDQFMLLFVSDLAKGLEEINQCGEVTDVHALSIGLLLRNLLNLEMSQAEENGIVGMFTSKNLDLELIQRIETNPIIDHDSGETQMETRLGKIKAALQNTPDHGAVNVPKISAAAPMEPQLDILERTCKNVFHEESRAFLTPDFGEEAPEETYDPATAIYDENGFLNPNYEEPIPTEVFDPRVDIVDEDDFRNPVAEESLQSEIHDFNADMNAPEAFSVFESPGESTDENQAVELEVFTGTPESAVPLSQCLTKRRRLFI
nr:hypothetical protein [Candidatus Sigynarchaeota archaeon]